MAESAFWRTLKKKVPGHVMRVENPCMPGTPDVNICQEGGRDFWVEVKDVDDWPKRPSTRVFGNEGLRPDQVLWIRARVKVGGEVYILAKVADIILCLPGSEAEGFNEFNRAELEARNLDYRKVLGLVPR